eukprot:TRINITY_DN13688_c0_g1_i1.p1 TRINITY_DN13688_c0_g1~~TRINITY_DN13688_c0_g1_i1.p1  ORF type:complete len:202 (-),score=42.17 TRINITY_DN13688_c0_g1_i1:77-682(-)
MEKYFAPPDAQLSFKFPPGGGRAGDNVKQPFEILFKGTQKPAIVSPADVRAKVHGASEVVVQTRGAANKYAVYFNTDVPGKYTVTVFVRDYSASYDFFVSAATDPSKCYVRGSTQIKVGKYTCTVVLVDALGNEFSTSLDDTLEASIVGVEKSFGNLTIVANDNGTFTVTLDLFNPKSEYEIIFKTGGADIGKGPWKIRTD